MAIFLEQVIAHRTVEIGGHARCPKMVVGLCEETRAQAGEHVARASFRHDRVMCCVVRYPVLAHDDVYWPFLQDDVAAKMPSHFLEGCLGCSDGQPAVLHEHGVFAPVRRQDGAVGIAQADDLEGVGVDNDRCLDASDNGPREIVGLPP